MAAGLVTFLLLALVSESLSCSGGQLIACSRESGPHCLCFLIDNPAGGPTTFRTCTNSPDLPYSDFGVRVIQPGSFQNMDTALTLDLSYNAPPALNISSRSFVGLTSLTHLDLRGNELTSLPDCLLTPMTSLETLYLQSNNLSELNTEAFRNASKLKTLYVDDNKLTEIPSGLLEYLPSLANISLSSNTWDCSGPNVVTLVDLVHSGLVLNGDQLRCSNSTLVTDIVIDRGPVMMSSSVIMTSSTSSAVSPSPSSLVMTPTLTPSLLLPTPTSLPQNCRQIDNFGTIYGFFDWSETLIGQTVERQCPHGPEGGVASRVCGEGGKWGVVEGRECDNASDAALVLINLAESDLTLSNIESVSSSLSFALSTLTSISLDELEVVLDITDQLVSFSGASISVLNHSLQALDYLLSHGGESILEGGPDITNRLRLIIDTALLSSLSMNNSNLVLMFPHLAVGGVYISGTNHTHIIAVISVGEGGEEELVIGEEGGGGGEGGGGDVEVVIDGDMKGPVQVTVYNNDTGLFNTSRCGDNQGVQGDNDIAPVISVSDESTSGSETVTITYHNVDESKEDVVCVRWNESLNCAHGGWQTEGCQLMREEGDMDITCVCMNKGTFGLLDTHDTSVESTGDITIGVVEYVFYACCLLAASLYLPVILAVFFNKSLRVLPLKQCVANMAISQSLSLLVMAASYHPHTPRQLCYSLAVLLHYTLLVALAWLALYPVMAALKVFRRTWFEHYWLLVPVAGATWLLPAVIVGGVGASRYGASTDSPNLCWSEADIFPNYFTFLSALLMVSSLLITALTITTLCCSDYDLELPIHLRIASNQLNAVLYSATVILLYLTADSASHDNKYRLDKDYMLVFTAVLAVFCGGYFLLANGWSNSHIRSVLLCKEDPVLKRKVAHYQDTATHSAGSQTSSRTSDHRNFRRNGTRITDEMNLNYVNSYLGYDEGSAHVPLDMFGQVDQCRQGGGGRRVKDRREPMSGPTGFRNVGTKVPHTTSMV